MGRTGHFQRYNRMEIATNLMYNMNNALGSYYYNYQYVLNIITKFEKKTLPFIVYTLLIKLIIITKIIRYLKYSL